MRATKAKKQEVPAKATTPEKNHKDVRKTVTCRYCKTDTLIKAKPRNFLDSYVFPILRIGPYRCSNCKRRDYYFERA